MAATSCMDGGTTAGAGGELSLLSPRVLINGKKKLFIMRRMAVNKALPHTSHLPSPYLRTASHRYQLLLAS